MSAEWKRGPPRRKERKEGMEAEERGARREDRLGAAELCGRMLASYRSVRWCAIGTLFAHQKLGRWGFAREKWGWAFLFFFGGGCRKVVPNAHQCSANRKRRGARRLAWRACDQGVAMGRHVEHFNELEFGRSLSRVWVRVCRSATPRAEARV